MNRKDFIKNSSIVAAGLMMTSQSEALQLLKKKNKLGIQLFSIPKMLSEDFVKGIKFLSTHGYKELEFYGPYSFSADSAHASWKGAAQMLGFSGSGLYGRSISDVKKILKDHGMTTPGTHTDLDTLMNKMGPLAESANKLGQKYVTLPSVPEEYRKTTDDYKKIAEIFNKIGESAKKYGLKFGYHNHGYGVKPDANGVMPLQLILDNTDPKLVFFEMDVFWTAAGGQDPIALLDKYPNRYKMLHIKDMKEKKTFSGNGGTVPEWISLFPLMTPAGQGVLNVGDIIKKGVSTGVEHFFVEQDMVADPATALNISANFVKKMI
jgi:sugar phosphate isomerase/epimerase